MSDRLRELEGMSIQYNEDKKAWEFNRRMFAELIVQDCIDVYNDDGYQTDAVSDNRVLKHFGMLNE